MVDKLLEYKLWLLWILNKMTFQNQILAGASSAADYEIDYSCRFNDNDSAHLTRTPGSAGNRRTWTYSVWMKRSNVYPGSTTEKNLLSAGPSGSGQDQETEFKFYDSSDGGMRLLDYSGLDPADTYAFDVVTDRVFLDVSSWTHYVFRYDSTQSTATDRFRVYINGYETTYSSRGGQPTAPAEDHQTAVCSNVSHFIGKYSGAAIQYMDGYIAEAHLIDGTSLGPSSFGKTSPKTGQWIPIEYTGGSYGTTGFYLDFADSGDLGKDVSGNGNDWTSSGLAANDQMPDTPTNNYCTWNLYDRRIYTYDYIVLANGNLDASTSNATGIGMIGGTVPASSGKWYWENTLGSATLHVGILATSRNVSDGVAQMPGDNTKGWMYRNDGQKENGSTMTSYGDTFTTSDVISVAWDADIGAIWFAKNGTWQASATQAEIEAGTTTNAAFSSGIAGVECRPMSAEDSGTAVHSWTGNFGQSSFTGTMPSGFKHLSTSNLSAPTIDDPSDYFQTVLYAGDGSDGYQVTGVGFEPDMFWIKNRVGTEAHYIFDSSRGVATDAGKNLSPDSTGAEVSDASVKAITSDGFTVQATGAALNTGNHVVWNWLEGATPGFDVGLGTGGGGQTTVAHSLGVVPNLIIWKSREGTSNWFVWSDTFSNLNDHTLFLNTTAATVTSGYGSLYGTQTSSQTSILTSGVTDGIDTGEDFVVYAFAAVEGFSAFGTYTGSGDEDGPFIWTGFKPRFVMTKRTSATEEWSMRDSARSGGEFGSAPGTNGRDPTGGNGLQWNIAANSDAPGEDNATGSRLTNFFSNGFKVYTTNTAINADGSTYLWMAFAESPFKTATAR